MDTRDQLPRLKVRFLVAAVEALVSEIAPIDDIRSTALYRARVACNLLREFLGDHG